MAGHTIVNLKPNIESRFATVPLELENSGMGYGRLAAGFRQPFGHKHGRQEELYVVVGGSVGAKLDDEVVEVGL